MSNAMTISQPGGLPQFSPAQMGLIKRTYADGTTKDEFDMYMAICQDTGLNPFKGQIYCIIYNADKPDKRKVTFITSIGGYRALAMRSGDYRPASGPVVFEQSDELKNALNPEGLISATITVHKQDNRGEWFPVVATAYWSEFAPLKAEWGENEQGKWKPTGNYTLTGKWPDMPRHMLAKCAEAHALRQGWPEDIGAVYTEDEMEREMIDITASEAMEKYQAEERVKAIGGVETLTFQFGYGADLESVQLGDVADRCIVHCRDMKDPMEVELFKQQNRVSLQQFWAQRKSDALDLRDELDKIVASMNVDKDEGGQANDGNEEPSLEL